MPAGLRATRLVVIGVGKVAELTPKDFIRFGGLAIGRLPNSAADASIFAELPGGAMRAEQAADLAQGARLRAYAFDRYKTKRKEDEKPPAVRNVTIAVSDIAAVRKSDAPRVAISDGIILARDLVNEPANVLYPEEFARRVGILKKLRVAVEVLDARAMKKLGMWINILLSGDNAVVIAMACRGLPHRQRVWGMILGAGVAVGLRIIFTGVVASLMLLPYLKIVGGLALFYIAAKLLVPDDPDESEAEAAEHLWRAVRIVAIADIIMSLDNVIAIAAAAGGNMLSWLVGIPIKVKPLLVSKLNTVAQIVFACVVLGTVGFSYPLPTLTWVLMSVPEIIIR